MYTSALPNVCIPASSHLSFTRLEFDNTTKQYHEIPGVEIKAPGFGDTDTVEYLDPSLKIDTTNYFHNMVDYLVTHLGYVRSKTIRAAPYDWRFGPCEYGHNYNSILHIVVANM